MEQNKGQIYQQHREGDLFKLINQGIQLIKMCFMKNLKIYFLCECFEVINFSSMFLSLNSFYNWLA